jgi:hypothetical protein
VEKKISNQKVEIEFIILWVRIRYQRQRQTKGAKKK